MKRTRLWTWPLVIVLVLALNAGTAWPQDPVQAQPAGAKAPKVNHMARQTRPIQLGTSGGSVTDLANGYCCSGTLGALVQDAGGTQYVLSNTHVFAGDSVPGGNGVVSQEGDSVDQPGYVDVQCDDIPADYVATVSDWVPLLPNGYSTVDAALAQVLPGKVDPQGRILEIGTISSRPIAAFLNQAVKKSGRTSGLTTGKVAGLDATISVQYTDECAGNTFVTTFTGQILITPGKFLKAGDSGSLMVQNVSTNPRAVGLLYAGSSRVAIASPIQDALDAFGVTLVDAAGSALSSDGAEQGALPPGLAKASQAKARNSARLLSVPGAVGHAVGLTAGKPVINVLVEKLTPGGQQAVPQEVDGVPVAIWEVGKIVAY